MDEGDLLYMPSALPAFPPPRPAAASADRPHDQDVPEVASVLVRRPRRDRTDPAPLEMFETTIRFKPREQWRPGMTPEKLVEELDAR